MKILFLVRSLGYGGAERQLVLLARGLAQRGHAVAVAVFYPGGPLEVELATAAVPVLSLDKRGRWDILRFLVRLVRTVAKERPDVVHSYLCNLVTIVLKPFFPKIKIVWGIRSSYVDWSRYDWSFRVTHALAARCARFTDLMIANSHAGRQSHVADGYAQEKIVVIPNGIDTARFCPNLEARERTRREWGIAKDEELIGVVGRLDPMKDHETFLQAAQLLLNVRQTVRFVCVGDGLSDYRAALIKRASVLGISQRVLWIGMRPDVTSVYSAFDLLVNCSYGEGFPNVIGEAMACGIPCVVTDVGDSGLVIGEFGELVTPRDPAALKAGMQRALDRKPSIVEIRRRIAEHFSVETLVFRTERTLTRLFHQPSTAVSTEDNTSLC